MTESLRIGIAQLNPTVGDVAGNVARIREAREACADADLVVY
jgi:NAD+ synthase